MTNEQLTQEVISIREHQAKCDAEHQKYELFFKEMQEEIKATRILTEDVHMLAKNMERMQTSIEDINKKVDSLASKEFVEYKENKKIIKQNIINKVTGAIIGFAISAVGFGITIFVMKGGQ